MSIISHSTSGIRKFSLQALGIGMAIGALLGTVNLAQADVLKIPVGSQSEQQWTIDRPHTGMNREQVRALFGDPESSVAATGEPPISSWVYEQFTVYFEYNHVIHTVLKHKPVDNN